MEDGYGNVVADHLESVIAQPKTDTILSIIGDDDCENLKGLQAIDSSNITTATSLFSTSAPAISTAERDIGPAFLSKTGHTTELRRDEQKKYRFIMISKIKTAKKKRAGTGSYKVIGKAVKDKIYNNWADTNEDISKSEVSK